MVILLCPVTPPPLRTYRTLANAYSWQNPFGPTSDSKDEDNNKDASSPQPQSQPNGGTDKPDPRTENADKQSGGAPPSIEANTGPNEKGAKEQAATTAPEGTEDAEVQRKGEATRGDKQIG